ncbi:MAG TPA: hypothetical protein PK657_09690 [Legionella sp.]|nr:hypothetical protein [Legionella sp.]
MNNRLFHLLDDLRSYFEELTRKAFLIKIEDQLAGFVLLRQLQSLPINSWDMSEFFILSKFQGKGVGGQVAQIIWNTYPGYWEVSIIPENKSALAFWRKIISVYTNKNYNEEIKTITYDKNQPQSYFLTFDSCIHSAIGGV